MADDQDMKRMIKLQEETLKAQKAGNQTKSLIYYIVVTIFTGGTYWLYQLFIKQPAKLAAATTKYAVKGTVVVSKLAVKGSVAGARIAKSEYDRREAAKAAAPSAKRAEKSPKKGAKKK
jgi:hypothetical protein